MTLTLTPLTPGSIAAASATEGSFTPEVLPLFLSYPSSFIYPSYATFPGVLVTTVDEAATGSVALPAAPTGTLPLTPA